MHHRIQKSNATQNRENKSRNNPQSTLHSGPHCNTVELWQYDYRTKAVTKLVLGIHYQATWVHTPKMYIPLHVHSRRRDVKVVHSGNDYKSCSTAQYHPKRTTPTPDNTVKTPLQQGGIRNHCSPFQIQSLAANPNYSTFILCSWDFP